MKALLLFKSALIIAGLPLLFSCQKETLTTEESAVESVVVSKSSAKKDKKQHARPLKASITGTWSVIGASDGVSLLLYGKTEGLSTLTGPVTTFYNTYFNPLTLETTFAPVTDNPDFDPEAYGLDADELDEVSVVTFDKHGNSLWAKITGNEVGDLVGIRQYFTGTYEIVGGTGKFVGATGYYIVEGYYEVEGPLDITGDLSFKLTGTVYY